jgi:hypothetical protein
LQETRLEGWIKAADASFIRKSDGHEDCRYRQSPHAPRVITLITEMDVAKNIESALIKQ